MDVPVDKPLWLTLAVQGRTGSCGRSWPVGCGRTAAHGAVFWHARVGLQGRVHALIDQRCGRDEVGVQVVVISHGRVVVDAVGGSTARSKDGGGSCDAVLGRVHGQGVAYDTYITGPGATTTR